MCLLGDVNLLVASRQHPTTFSSCELFCLSVRCIRTPAHCSLRGLTVAVSSDPKRSNSWHLLQHDELLHCFIKNVQRLRFTGCHKFVTIHSCQQQSCHMVERLCCHTHNREADLLHGLYQTLEQQRGPNSVFFNCHATPCSSSSIFGRSPKMPSSSKA